MSDCIFCKIAQSEIPSEKVYEDDKILCFKDLDPQAPVHVLIIPKKHISSLDDVREEDSELLGYIMLKVREIAADLGLEMCIRDSQDIIPGHMGIVWIFIFIFRKFICHPAYYGYHLSLIHISPLECETSMPLPIFSVSLEMHTKIKYNNLVVIKHYGG